MVSYSWVIKSTTLTSRISKNTLFKASIAWDYPCFLSTLIHLIHICICHLDRDSLELNLYLVSYGYALGSFASAQLNHDLVT